MGTLILDLASLCIPRTEHSFTGHTLQVNTASVFKMATKEQWPEVVGKTGEEAKAAIQADRPDVTVEVMNELSPCTMDFRTDRVRVFVNNDGKVVGPPQCG